MTYNEYLKTGIEHPDTEKIINLSIEYVQRMRRIRTSYVGGMLRINTLEGKSYTYFIDDLILKQEKLSIYENSEKAINNEFLKENQIDIVHIAFENILQSIERGYRKSYKRLGPRRAFLSALHAPFNITSSYGGRVVYSFLIQLESLLKQNFSYERGKFLNRSLDQFSGMFEFSYYKCKVMNEAKLPEETELNEGLVSYIRELSRIMNSPKIGFILHILRNLEDCKKYRLFVQQYLHLGLVMGTYKVSLRDEYRTNDMFRLTTILNKNGAVFKGKHPIEYILPLKVKKLDKDMVEVYNRFLFKVGKFPDRKFFDIGHGKNILQHREAMEFYHPYCNLKWYSKNYSHLNLSEKGEDLFSDPYFLKISNKFLMMPLIITIRNKNNGEYKEFLNSLRNALNLEEDSFEILFHSLDQIQAHLSLDEIWRYLLNSASIAIKKDAAKDFFHSFYPLEDLIKDYGNNISEIPEKIAKVEKNLLSQSDLDSGKYVKVQPYYFGCPF